MITTKVSPILQWSGSRHKTAKNIIKRFPQNFFRYREPMIGGAGVFLSTEYKQVTISDSNTWLIDTYLAVRDNPQRVSSILSSITPSRQTYDLIRNIHPDSISLEYRAAHLIYLNHACFGGVFRLNDHGFFNVPFGRTSHTFSSLDRIERMSQALHGVDIICGDFIEVLKDVNQEDFVYFDPPSPEQRVFGYNRSESPASFEFTESDYLRLAHECNRLDSLGIKWAVTDNNTSLLRILLHKYNIIPVLQDKKDQEFEVILITNYPDPLS